MIGVDKLIYTVGVAGGTLVLDRLGASGDIISGAWERVAVDITLAASLLGAVIFIYSKVFEGAIDRKIDERVESKVKDYLEAHYLEKGTSEFPHGTEHP